MAPQIPVQIAPAVVSALTFRLTDLDLQVAALFYHHSAKDPWPEAQQPMWLLFHQAARVLAGLLTMGSLFVRAAGPHGPGSNNDGPIPPCSSPAR